MANKKAKKNKGKGPQEVIPGVTTTLLSKESRQKLRRWHFLVFVDDMLLHDDRYVMGKHARALEAAASLKADIEKEIPEKKITVKVVAGEALSRATYMQLIGMLQQENVLRKSLALAIKDHRDQTVLPEDDEIYMLDLKRRAIEMLKGATDPKLPEPEPESAIIDPNTNAPVKKEAPSLVTLPAAAMQQLANETGASVIGVN